MSFKLKWKGEIIEEGIETMQEAKYLQGEYTLAYGGSVRILREKNDINNTMDN